MSTGLEDITGWSQIWEGVTDTRGNPVDGYEQLSFYDGGFTGTEQKIFGPMAEGLWGVYANFARTQIVTLDWVMSLGWKDFVLGPLRALSNTATTIMATLGLRPFMLLLLGVGVALLLLRRKTGTAIAELFVGAAIAALAVGVLANPMAVVAGDNGAITQAEEVGQTLGNAIATGGESMQASDGLETRNALTSKLVDAFLRAPHQIINYGTIIDGTPCEEAYEQSLGDPDGRLIVGACDPALQETADNPGPTTVVNVTRLYPALGAFALFSGALALVSLGSVLACGWFGLTLIWRLLTGIVPGASRTGLFRSLGGLAASLSVLALSVPFVVAYMTVVTAVMSSAGGPVATLFRFDLIMILLLLGSILVVVLWIRMRKSGKRLAAAMAKLGKQSAAPAPHQVSAATRAREGLRDVTQMAHNAQNLKRGRTGTSAAAAAASEATPAPTPVDQNTPQRTPTSPVATQSKTLPSNPSHTVNNPVLSVPAAQDAPTAPERLKERLKKGTKTALEVGAHVGIAAGTGGTSLVATGAKTASTAAKASRLARAAQTARTAQTRVRQAAQIANEGRERLQRSATNLELRQRLSSTQQASTTEKTTPRPTSHRASPTPRPSSTPTPTSTPKTTPTPRTTPTSTPTRTSSTSTSTSTSTRTSSTSHRPAGVQIGTRGVPGRSERVSSAERLRERLRGTRPAR